MPYRRYTKAQKASAVAEASVNGVRAAEAATGIRESTIRYWLDQPEFAQLREKTREEMRDGFKVLVHRAQERLTALVPTMEPRDLTILLGVATDKSLLLSGDATGRTEHRSLTDGFNDHEKRALADSIRSALAEDGAEAAAEGDAAGAAVVGAGTPGATGT